VKQADPQNPVSRGVKPFEARDEFYFKMRYMPDAKPVITATLKDYPKYESKEYPDAAIGWVYIRKDNKGPLGEGRSFGFTGCHFHQNWGIEDFRRMIVNGILWSAGVDVPPGGAPVALKGPVPKIPEAKGAN
jgi:type 1 glutamine amidotransferase